MSKVIQFRPRSELSAKENIRAFVAYCKSELTVFGADLPFQLDRWDVSHTFRRRGTNTAVTISFDDWEAGRARRSSSMSEPMKSFAKSYVRYRQAFKLNAYFATQVLAFRALEWALRQHGKASRPWACDASVLSHASQLVADRYAQSVAYGVGRELERIVAFMSEHRMFATALDWRNPLPRAQDTQRVGPEFDRLRNEKLPSAAALNALAQIFRTATDVGDRLVISLLAVLCSAPDRMNEVLRLPAHCEVHDRVPSTGEPIFGLRWMTSKEGDPMVKWIVKSMADVVREAVSIVKEATEPARLVARWYEENPTKMYIREDLEHLRQRVWITSKEAGQIVFQEERSQGSVRQWLATRGIPIVRRGTEYGLVRFIDLERVIIGMLPRGFPFIDERVGLRYSNALCTFFRNSFHKSRSVYSGVIDVIEHGDVHSRLGSEPQRSIFRRFGFTEDDGSQIRVKSHQFRHYLNTLAQAGGLSQLDIAKWSGRRDVGQNNVYDHVSDRDIIAELAAATSKVVALPSRVSVSLVRADFAALDVATAHTTDFGYCVHDFAMLPCQLHADCMNCDEQVCVKGDPVREANIRRQLEETRGLLTFADSAARDGDVGAGRWQDHQRQTLARLVELCSLLDDPSIPNGSLIRLSPSNSQSRMKLSVAKRLEAGLKVDAT